MYTNTNYELNDQSARVGSSRLSQSRPRSRTIRKLVGASGDRISKLHLSGNQYLAISNSLMGMMNALRQLPENEKTFKWSSDRIRMITIFKNIEWSYHFQ